MSTIIELAQHLHGGMSALSADAVPNPGPKAPSGTSTQASNIMGYIKYGALYVILAAGFIGAGALAGGHFLHHSKSSQAGMKILIGAVVAAVVYAAIYAFLTGVTGSK